MLPYLGDVNNLSATQGLDRLSLTILSSRDVGGGRMTLSELARKAWRFTAEQREAAVIQLIEGKLARKETIPAFGRRGPDPQQVTLTPRGQRLSIILKGDS